MVEIILLMILLTKDHDNNFIPVIQAAILGSILANLLLCLGLCFFVGGMNRHEQEFDGAISEVGSGLLLVAIMGFVIPSAFYASLRGTLEEAVLESKSVNISRVTAIMLLVAFAM